MKLFKRFVAYYKPFLNLFILDISVATFSSVLSILFPMLTRYLLNKPIPERDYHGMTIIFAIMIAVYIIQAVSNYVRIRWGHILGVRMENKMREDLFSHLQTLSFSYFDKNSSNTGNTAELEFRISFTFVICNLLEIFDKITSYILSLKACG